MLKCRSALILASVQLTGLGNVCVRISIRGRGFEHGRHGIVCVYFRNRCWFDVASLLAFFFPKTFTRGLLYPLNRLREYEVVFGTFSDMHLHFVKPFDCFGFVIWDNMGNDKPQVPSDVDMTSSSRCSKHRWQCSPGMSIALAKHIICGGLLATNMQNPSSHGVFPSDRVQGNTK